MKVTAQSGAAFARQNDLELASALDSGFSHAGVESGSEQRHRCVASPA
jgi:hypothetical protein